MSKQEEFDMWMNQMHTLLELPNEFSSENHKKYKDEVWSKVTAVYESMSPEEKESDSGVELCLKRNRR